ncbi:hypothetical protein ACS5PN_30005 [Roseateles sp. NT4]|uniref:hypothetical protein n=1 Tax=Roseateles sp. NT4 TaxID=3453715 RepID=UPI003EEC035C
MKNLSERGLWVCVVYNLINLVLFATFFKEATIIRGDGPGGFGEAALKGLLLLNALAAFIAGVVSSVVAYRESWSGSRLWRPAVASLVLLLFAVLAVCEACSDGAGHCRHWQIFWS